MKRTDILKHLVFKHAYKSYLEIGVQFSGNNFDLINVPQKIGVDPVSGGTHRMTSDQFFMKNNQQFDLIYIDGLHHAHQVLKDFNNSLRCLSKGGSIVLHDCSPGTKEAQIVPRKQKAWNGDVWRTWVSIIEAYPQAYCINTNEGCGVIENLGKQRRPLLRNYSLVSYEEMDSNRKRLLHLIEVPAWLKEA